MIVSGTVSRDAELAYTQSKGLPKVTFGVRFDRKQFMNVMALGDSQTTMVAAGLEKDDAVFVIGTWSCKKYRTKKGEDKTWEELKADLIIPQAMALGTTKDLPMDNGDPDAFESANDDEMDYGSEEEYDYETTL